MVSGHSCVRVHKIALPLIEKGHEVHLIARKQTNFSPYYRTFLHYDDIGQCIESIKLHRDADLFHVHNEPSWFVCAIKEVSTKPVILDVHDTFLSRSTPDQSEAASADGSPHLRVSTEERNAFQAADGLVFVSNQVRDIAMGEFGLTQPYTVLPSYVPSTYYQYHTKEWLGGLVYEGRVSIPEEFEILKNGTGANYCDYRGVCEATQNMGMDFHLYSGREDKPFTELYKNLAYVHPGYAYRDLLRQVSRHDWGLVGNLIDSPQWQATTPNKLFDYLAAGVPSVCINAGSSSEIVKEHGFGITVGSLDELGDRWGEHREKRNQLWKVRQPLSMEANIHKVTDLYRNFV
jgi:glycosyltransferase involved in cell wall biosynthesis